MNTTETVLAATLVLSGHLTHTLSTLDGEKGVMNTTETVLAAILFLSGHLIHTTLDGEKGVMNTTETVLAATLFLAVICAILRYQRRYRI